MGMMAITSSGVFMVRNRSRYMSCVMMAMYCKSLFWYSKQSSQYVVLRRTSGAMSATFT